MFTQFIDCNFYDILMEKRIPVATLNKNEKFNIFVEKVVKWLVKHHRHFYEKEVKHPFITGGLREDKLEKLKKYYYKNKIVIDEAIDYYDLIKD